MRDPIAVEEADHDLKWISWLLLVAGLLSIAAGVIVLAKPSHSLKTLAVVAGIFILVDGVFELGASLSRRTANRGLVALLGVISAIVGIFLIRHPVAGIVAVALLIGFWLITVGIIRFVTAFEIAGRRFWNVVLAVIEVIAGIVVVASPGIGYVTLALLVGISFIAQGVGMSGLGWDMRSLRNAVKPGGHTAPAT
jgi:uncharacterized membrane protein HdeD (DUF308 family)